MKTITPRPLSLWLLLGCVVLLPALAMANNGADSVGTFWLEDGDSGDRWDITFRDVVAYAKYDESLERDETMIVLSDQMINRERMKQELGDDEWWHPHGYKVEIGLCSRDEGYVICQLNISLSGKSISTSGSLKLGRARSADRHQRRPHQAEAQDRRAVSTSSTTPMASRSTSTCR